MSRFVYFFFNPFTFSARKKINFSFKLFSVCTRTLSKFYSTQKTLYFFKNLISVPDINGRGAIECVQRSQQTKLRMMTQHTNSVQFHDKRDNEYIWKKKKKTKSKNQRIRPMQYVECAHYEWDELQSDTDTQTVEQRIKIVFKLTIPVFKSTNLCIHEYIYMLLRSVWWFCWRHGTSFHLAIK